MQGPDFRVRVQRTSGPAEEFTEAELAPVPGPVRNFADAVLAGAKLFSPAEHGVHVTEVLEAAYRSAGEGVSVRIED
mgnify:CR=1 FL=1